MASGRFARARDLQHSSSSLLKAVSSTGEPCYITEDGRARAVLMDINRYNALMDLVEETESPHENKVGDETRQHVSVQGIIRSSQRVVRRRR